jgi:hypothetical protein
MGLWQVVKMAKNWKYLLLTTQILKIMEEVVPILVT